MDIGGILSQYGLPGVIIFVLGSVVVYLSKKNDALIAKLFDVQEARRLESLETSRQLTQTMTTFSQSAELLTGKIVDVQQRRRK